MTRDKFPEWLRPPPEGFAASDLDRLPGLPPHTELIDGSLVFASPQTQFHSLAITLLESALRQAAPPTLRIRRQMTVTLGQVQRPEPDVIAVHADRDGGLDLTTYRPDEVVLVVEVVCRASCTRDRERKPQLYATAGIRHFWRVESVDSRVVVYVYELDFATNRYVLTGIHRERLTLSVPFELDIDLSDIDSL
ncbi:Uma2 family endonuclease [Nocardia sp. NPDC005978]|uniref:Uma2 family endonuclease n=1 Tax=Nocardia sp. NPDC005978 TaxID=3156725 RepID=UPI0033B0E189